VYYVEGMEGDMVWASVLTAQAMLNIQNSLEAGNRNGLTASGEERPNGLKKEWKTA
jgi:hypothetical protein